MRRRAVVAALLVLMLLADGAVAHWHAPERYVGIRISGQQGSTSIRMIDAANPVSPACGCYDPSFGVLSWYGMAVPSEGFTLGVRHSSSPAVESERWALTAMAPDQDSVDWYGVPTHTLRIRVTAQHDGALQRRLFSGRATHLVVKAEGAVDVRQPERYPYAAVIPAAGGSTRFKTAAGVRPTCCQALSVAASAPARDDEGDTLEGGTSAASARRGPIIDVLGPTIRFSFTAGTGTEIWTALSRVQGVRRGDEVSIAVTTPYALELIAHPVQHQWASQQPSAWPYLLDAAAKGEPGATDVVKGGPLAQGRYVLTGPMPRYSVVMSDVALPSNADWSSFSQRSASKDSVRPFLGESKLDGDVVTTMYGLPPVTKRAQIGVFGRIGHLESRASSGEIVHDGDTTAVTRGQVLSVSSGKGVQAGRFAFTPVVSAGSATDRTDLAGRAAVRIDGAAVVRPQWAVWLLGVIGTALIGLVVEGVIAWIRRSPRPAVS